MARLPGGACAPGYYQGRRQGDLVTWVGTSREGMGVFASESSREGGPRHMVDSLKRKAHAGHVHGGKVFGYTNLRVAGHAEYRIHPEQAPVVRRIFTEYAAGQGLRPNARVVHAEHSPCPRPSKRGADSACYVR